MKKNKFNIEGILQLKKIFFQGEDTGTTIWFILMYQMWKGKSLD
jgi:asparagine synthase (glutamine-hydrolysing)